MYCTPCSVAGLIHEAEFAIRGFFPTYNFCFSVPKMKMFCIRTSSSTSNQMKAGSASKEENKMGIRASNTTELVFQDCYVPMENRLGREGQGFRIAMQTLDSARPFVASVAVGVAQSALDIAAHYARERRQFGQPISSFQLIQGMVADMAMKVHGARLMVQQACWMRDQGLEFGMEAAMSKCFASDVAMEVTTDAVQIMGGYGYMKDYPMEKKMRDAKILQIYEGTNQIQRLVIANKILY